MSDLDKINSSENDGPDDGEPGTGVDKQENSFKAITTQEDFDKAVQRRITRVENKYKDYDELKGKAEQFDQLEAERSTENEKLLKRAEKAEKERDEANGRLAKSERLDLVRDVADELGLPKKLINRVQGDTEEDIRADIEDLMDGLPSTKKSDEGGDTKPPPSQKPKQKTTFTATGDESDDGLTESADDILKDIG